MAEQQIRRDHQNDFDRRRRNDQTRNKERRADQHFRERVTAFLVLLLLLGGDDLDLALDIRADLADFREQSVRVFALDAQLADLVLHLGGAVGAAEVFERVDTLAVFAVVSGRGSNDLRLALDARADLADLREQGIRVFAGHAQLLGFKDKHAVLHAVQLTDALLHFRRAVCTADILKRVNALDAVAPCGVLVMMVVMLVVVVVTAAAVVVIIVMVVMVFVLMVVAAAAVVVIVMVVMVFVLVVVTAAAVVVIVMVVMVFVRFFYFLCVRSGFFLLLFCHCCRLLIRNNI